MNKFLKDLEKELKKLSVNPKEIKEILEDHKEMIEAAKQEGLNEDQISNKFGNPEKVATELYQDLKDSDAKINLDNLDSLTEFDTKEFNFVKSFNLVPEGLNILISLISDDFILSDYDGEALMVYEKKIKKIDDYEISLDDKEFILKKKSGKNILSVMSFKVTSGEFLVLIPKGLKSKSFKQRTVSGDVSINQLNVESFNLKSTNGDIGLSNVELGETSFNLVNGDIEIKGMKASSFDASVVNGDIKIDNAIIKGNIFFNSVSGDVKLVKVECDNASFKTVSGDVNGENFYLNEVSYKSVSGDLVIKNDDKSREIIVKSKKTLSGDIKIN